MDRSAYVAANRAAWDASAPHHRTGESWRGLADGFADPGFSCLDALEVGLLSEAGVAGAAVAQVGCNNARELISVARLGAARCVGFDQSAAFLAQGRELAAIAGAEVDLVQADVYALPAGHEAQFDIVLVTIGVVGWMPDLPGFCAVLARLLRQGGRLILHEQHPVTALFEPFAAEPWRPVNDYFEAEPFAEQGPILYDGSEPAPGEPRYWFHHTLGAVVTAVADTGLVIRRLLERPDNIASAEWDRYAGPESPGLPLSYALVADRP
jgi:SAM-dependent methyltransferase